MTKPSSILSYFVLSCLVTIFILVGCNYSSVANAQSECQYADYSLRSACERRYERSNNYRNDYSGIYICGSGGCVDRLHRTEDWILMCHLGSNSVYGNAIGSALFEKTKLKFPWTSCIETFSYVLEKKRNTYIWDRLNFFSMFNILYGDVLNLCGNIVNTINETISLIWIWNIVNNITGFLGAICQLIFSIIIFVSDVIVASIWIATPGLILSIGINFFIKDHEVEAEEKVESHQNEQPK